MHNNTKFTSLSQPIRNLDDLKYVLKRFRVPFQLCEENPCSEGREVQCTYIHVRGNRVASFNHHMRYLMVWFNFKNSEGFTTKSEGFKDSEDLTLLDVIEFCEEYHRRVFLFKEKESKVKEIVR